MLPPSINTAKTSTGERNKQTNPSYKGISTLSVYYPVHRLANFFPTGLEEKQKYGKQYIETAQFRYLGKYSSHTDWIHEDSFIPDFCFHIYTHFGHAKKHTREYKEVAYSKPLQERKRKRFPTCILPSFDDGKVGKRIF